MRFLKNTLLALATGYGLFFYSERLFWSAFKPGDRVGDLVITWLAYSVLGYLLLSVVYAFRVGSAAAAFLAGAFYGWLTEGTLVGTLYGTEASAPFPLSLLVTGVSWHALISVWVGWYFLPRALRRPTPGRALAWAAGVGLFWGVWATFLWKETPPVVVPVKAFAAHALAAGGLLIASYWVIGRAGRIGAGGSARAAAPFRPRPFGLAVSVLLIGTFYVQQVKALGVRPLVVLPGVLAVALLALWRLRRGAHSDGAEDDTVAAPPSAPQPPRPINLLYLLAMPALATTTYALAMRAGWWPRVPVAVGIMYGVTAPAGAVVLAWALFRAAWTGSAKRLPKTPA